MSAHADHANSPYEGTKKSLGAKVRPAHIYVVPDRSVLFNSPLS
jgi:hypothetical protein